MADPRRLGHDIYFGEPGKPPPDWRKDLADRDEDDPDEDELESVRSILGFDPVEADDGDDHDGRPAA